MQVHNVHERVLDAPAAAVGRLLDGIGGPHDALWPSPEWSPMWLDGPPAVGTAGGHGALRYRVTTYEPGRRIVFTLDPGQDLSGWHGFEVVPRGPDRAVLRHVVAGRARGGMRLLWPCVVRPVHDGIVEQILDRAELALGTGPARATRLSAIARLARWAARPRARATRPARRPTCCRSADFVDAFAVRLRPGMPTDPVRWASAIFDSPPRWVRALLAGPPGGWSGWWASNARGARRSPSATTPRRGGRRRGRAAPRLSGSGHRRAHAGRADHRRAAAQPARAGLLRAGPPDPPGGRRGDAHPGGHAALPPARRLPAFPPVPLPAAPVIELSGGDAGRRDRRSAP